MSRPKKRARKHRLAGLYTKGDLNYVVDSLLHPLIEKDRRFIIVDEAAHALIEQDPRQSVLKFSRYRLPDLLRELWDILLEPEKPLKRKRHAEGDS